MLEAGEYTTEEAKEALSLTAEEIEELENMPEEPLPPLGKFGNLFWTYLQENQQSRYTYHMLEMDMRDLAVQVNQEARDMMDTVTEQLRKRTPRPKGDFMAIVQYETAIRDQAEEIVLHDIVYKIR